METKEMVKHTKEIVWVEPMGRWKITPFDKNGCVEAIWYCRDQFEAIEILKRYQSHEELLEACKDYIEIKEYLKGSMLVAFRDVTDNMEAAIARAEGRHA